MKVIVADTYEEGAKKAADIIEKLVRENPTCTLGLAQVQARLECIRNLQEDAKKRDLISLWFIQLTLMSM